MSSLQSDAQHQSPAENTPHLALPLAVFNEKSFKTLALIVESD